MSSSELSINFYGYFTPLGGYGIVNLAWVKYLRRLGVKVSPHMKFNILPGTHEWTLLTDEEKEIFKIPWEKKKVGIIETTPFDFHLIDTEIKIANTMCESSLISHEWVDPCNSMNYVIVPNEWNKKVFIESGVTVPIKVIPHGIDQNNFPFFKRVRKPKFRFGIVGYLNDRKGVFDLIQAFTSEFDKEEPVELYLKSSNKAFGFYSNFSDPRIITDVRHISFQELNKLYQTFDCFVFPSKAEGIGMPPREALSTGCPVIVGNYSGLEEICNPDHVYPINPQSFVERTDMVEQPGKWANYNIQEIMGNMRHIYENWDEALKKAELGSKFIGENLNWEKVTKELINFLEEIDT